MNTDSQKYFIGLDLHKNTSTFCVKDRDGRIIDERKLATEPSELKGYLKRYTGAALAVEPLSQWYFYAERKEAAQQKLAEAQQRMETKRKEVLLKLVDIQVKWMERTKERVQRMPNIADELKTQLAGEVDAAIQNLNAEKTKIEAASGQDAIKALAKEVRDLFKSKHELVKQVVDAIHASRANDAVAKAEERATAMKAKVNELKGQGKNTADVESDLEDAEKDVDDAQAAIGRKAFKEANDDLKGAYQKFREIAQKAKGLQ